MTDFPCLFSWGTHVASTPPVAKGHDHKRNCAVRKRVSTLCYDFPLDYHFQCQIIQFIRTNSTSGLSIRMASCMPDTLTHTHTCVYIRVWTMLQTNELHGCHTFDVHIKFDWDKFICASCIQHKNVHYSTIMWFGHYELCNLILFLEAPSSETNLNSN